MVRVEREAATKSRRSERGSELERAKGLVFKNPRHGVCSSWWPQVRGSAMETQFERSEKERDRATAVLCKSLASLQRYWEALEIINLTLRLAHSMLSVEKEEELRSLGAQIAYNTTDPKHGFDCVRYIVQQHPYSLAAWNCYYKVISRVDNRDSRHFKFLRGTALINLALGFRLQNKHQCLAQGLAFLYNNLRLCENSQVLAIREKDYPMPKLPCENPDIVGNQKPGYKLGYCDLRREAAYNLHLIYKKSGALDLASQVLKDHCTI
nr:hypothetical protein CFP56_29651 [Quercus suber]